MSAISMNWGQVLTTYIKCYGTLLLLALDLIYDSNLYLWKLAALVVPPYLIYHVFGTRWWSILLAVSTFLIIAYAIFFSS